MAKDKKIIALSGRNIFVNNKGQTIYYVKSSRIGYVIPESEFNRFRMLQNRIVIGAVAAIFLSVFANVSYLMSGILGIAVYVFLEFVLRSKLLPKCTQFANFVPEKAKSTIEVMAQEDNKRLILKIVLWFALSILLIVNLYTMKQEPDLIIKLTSVAFSIYAFIVACMQLKALLMKK